MFWKRFIVHDEILSCNVLRNVKKFISYLSRIDLLMLRSTEAFQSARETFPVYSSLLRVIGLNNI